MLFKLGHFFTGGGPIFLRRSMLAPEGKKRLVVGATPLVEDLPVAAGDLQIEVSEQCGANVDRSWPS